MMPNKPLKKRLTALVLFTLLSSCGVHLAAGPHIEGDVSVRIVEGGIISERVLRAESIEAQHLSKWLDENADGWHGYYATTPRDGVFVSTRLGALQFSRDSVIAVGKEGQYAKRTSEGMYELLRGKDGT